MFELNNFLIPDLVDIVMQYLLRTTYYHKHFTCDPSTKIYAQFVELIKTLQKFSESHTDYTYKNISNQKMNKYIRYNVSFIGKVNKGNYIFVYYNISPNYELDYYRICNIKTIRI